MTIFILIIGIASAAFVAVVIAILAVLRYQDIKGGR